MVRLYQQKTRDLHYFMGLVSCLSFCQQGVLLSQQLQSVKTDMLSGKYQEQTQVYFSVNILGHLYSLIFGFSCIYCSCSL